MLAPFPWLLDKSEGMKGMADHARVSKRIKPDQRASVCLNDENQMREWCL